MDQPSTPASLRDRTRLAMREEVAATAIALFAEHGFAAVTTAQIASAAGISPRSFFRYFATKEDVVLGGLVDSGRRVSEALAARPEGEAAWDALREALHVLVDDPIYPSQHLRAIARIILDTPSIRARDLEKYQQWEAELAPEVARRLEAAHDEGTGGTGGTAGAELRARALIAAACACLRIATGRWLMEPASIDPAGIFDELMAAVRN